jgi:hypothetical protein
VSGSDPLLTDLSKAMVYVNGVKMPCYYLKRNCTNCGINDDTSKTNKSDSTRTDTTEASRSALPVKKGGKASEMAGACTMLVFTLTKDSTAIWDNWYGFFDYRIGVSIDIGTTTKMITCNTDKTLTVITSSPTMFGIGLTVVIIFLIVSVWMAFVAKSNILKDRSDSLEKKPYSLARFQLYWWSIIVISSYILLFSIRDHFSLLNATALILMGISITSTGFAFLIDYSDSDKVRHQDKPGVNFFTDVLSDDDGVSIHRFQNLIFTFLFGIIFIYKVFDTGRMPVFGQTELFLMGLSSAAYLALKAGENKTAPPVSKEEKTKVEATNPDLPDNAPKAVG